MEIGEIIMDCLTVAEKRCRRRHTWYRRWFELAQKLKKRCHNAEACKDIMINMFHMLDCGAFKYQRIAYSAHTDLYLVFEDCIDNKCEECERRFECYTE